MSAPEFAARLRVVLFDAGNTLLWIDHERIAGIVREAGCDVTVEEVRSAEMRARPRLDPLLGAVARRESRQVTRQYIAYVLEHLGVADAKVVERAGDDIAAAWATLWCRPPADAHHVVRTLRARGYRVGCISNSNGKVDRLLAAAGLLELLEDVVDSGSVGVEKPDPRIFEIATERMGVAPGDAVYVGDIHSLDVLGPRAAGMHAILLDPAGVWTRSVAPRIRALSDLLPWLPGRGP